MQAGDFCGNSMSPKIPQRVFLEEAVAPAKKRPAEVTTSNNRARRFDKEHKNTPPKVVSFFTVYFRGSILLVSFSSFLLITSFYMTCSYPLYKGPAALIASLALVNFSKFLWNSRANFCACLSYASLSSQVLRGTSTSSGTPGT